MYKVENSIKYNDYFGYIYAQTFDIDGMKVKIEHFCDKDHNGEKRYSYEVIYSGRFLGGSSIPGKRGTHASGGYGNDNEIVFPTFGSAFDSAIRIVCYPLEANLDKYREIKLNILLDV
jgi:hypothetical protein